MPHKSISPIISIILLIVITISIASTSYIFLNNLLFKQLSKSKENIEEIYDISLLQITNIYWYDYRDGLVLELRFDEGEGNIVKDYSGNGNDGILYGVYGLKFDGVDDYVDVGNNPDFIFSGEFSIEVWVKHSSTSNQIYVSKWTGAGNDYAYWLGFYQSKLAFGYYRGSGYILFGSNIADGKWHHIVAIVRSNGKIELWVDDIKVKEDTKTVGTVGSNSAPLTIGNYNGASGSWHFNGTIAEVRIYNRALSQEEIRRLYEKGPCYDTVKEGLVLWLCLDKEFSKDSTTIKDLSGNNNDGTINGATFVEITDLPKAYNRKWVKGPIGYAINFDGLDDYVEIPDSPSLRPNQLTARVLFRANYFSTSWWANRVVDKYQNYGIVIKVLNHTHGRIHFDYKIGGSWVGFNSNQIIEIGKVYSTAITFDGTVGRIYINGLLDNQNISPGSLTLNNNPVEIGRYQGGSQYFNGTIDEVRIYNKALDEETIKNLFYRIHLIVYNPSDKPIELNNTYFSIGDCILPMIINKTFITSDGDSIIYPKKQKIIKLGLFYKDKACSVKRGEDIAVCLIYKGRKNCRRLYVPI